MKELTINANYSKPSKIYKTKFLIEYDNLMKVKSNAECSPWGILQYF